MNTIYKLLPFLRAYRNNPTVKKYQGPVIGCIGCASLIIIVLVILIIIFLFQIIGSIGIPEISDYTGNVQTQLTETISNVASNNNNITEQMRVLLLNIIDGIYTIIRSFLE